MKRQTLSSSGNSGLVGRGYNLGLKIVPNIPKILTLGMLEYFEQNLHEIPQSLEKGFVFVYENRNTVNNQTNICPFSIWKTIKLGTSLKNPDNFRNALAQNECRIDQCANDILGKPAFTASKTEVEVDLVNVSVAELGFRNGAKRSKIYDRAKEFGLTLCPAEVGPQLRLQYLDQPNGECLRIAMDPIEGSGRDLGIFVVNRDDGGSCVRWFFAYFGCLENFWLADDRCVFVCPRSSARA